MSTVNIKGIDYEASKLSPSLRRQLLTRNMPGYCVSHFDVTVYCFGEFPVPQGLSFKEEIEYLYPLVSAAQKPIHQALAEHGIPRREFSVEVLANAIHATLPPLAIGILSQSPFVRAVVWEKIMRVITTKHPQAVLN